MIFWSFVAGVVTFYCSFGPDSLLPNIFFTIKYKPKQLGLQELFPQGHSCAVCGKVKCKRHRPSLLLENYQPWLDLKIPSKVDASLSELWKSSVLPGCCLLPIKTVIYYDKIVEIIISKF
uniref:Sorting nexin 14 n=1 Tax=Microcebus murinus TaxID=30608 RepID=A0A8C5W134_MICMU